MKSLYNINGLVFWDEKEIRIRRQIEENIKEELKSILSNQNPNWKFFQIEAPSLIPRELVNENYTNEDIWTQEVFGEETSLVLKPETTPSSYLYAKHLLNSNLVIPPFVVWQTSKSFRREQDNVLKNMRLKEFYQTEFQCFYSSDTLNDYQTNILEDIKLMFEEILNLECRIVESDRLPSYSSKTMDIEVFNNNRWMEISSISKRHDFDGIARIMHKNKVIKKNIIVLEIAIGLDRLVYNKTN